MSGRRRRIKCYVEQVKDFDEYGVTLMKQERGVPLARCLIPETDLEDGQQVVVAGIGMIERFQQTVPLGLRAQIDSISGGVVKVDNIYDCTAGGPILNPTSNRFVGMITSIEKDSWLKSGRASFCPLTLSSPLWIKIGQAMQRYLAERLRHLPVQTL
ncbi:hypothetical protein PHYSODRAFT_303541 [Phytophthora sojae]|uniref:Uncharacterized protein n=1 Tax=Phytophthora sojae (strain P6497) TaxID=1094619 RepID=G4ZVH7_PHYSP|nr:hypothetical protein PHYSODRAFT_303541 [Phytophthora sojae]EGZ11495.1 hypothetical protein PHYSODRAFT_303541 [Phytophthora sojae]|eukprot:XP_009531828.1 hypothetical protein PHYSODRAFT_303541 [Phytophthora sojae]